MATRDRHRGLTCIFYDRLMSDSTSDPTPDDIHRYILKTYPDTIVAAIEGGTFYSQAAARGGARAHGRSIRQAGGGESQP